MGCLLLSQLLAPFVYLVRIKEQAIIILNIIFKIFPSGPAVPPAPSNVMANHPLLVRHSDTHSFSGSVATRLHRAGRQRRNIQIQPQHTDVARSVRQSQTHTPSCQYFAKVSCWQSVVMLNSIFCCLILYLFIIYSFYFYFIYKFSWYFNSSFFIIHSIFRNFI